MSLFKDGTFQQQFQVNYLGSIGIKIFANGEQQLAHAFQTFFVASTKQFKYTFMHNVLR